MNDKIWPQADMIPHMEEWKWDCPWCWKAQYPGTPFPAKHNSQICKGHAKWLAQEVKVFYRKKSCCESPTPR